MWEALPSQLLCLDARIGDAVFVGYPVEHVERTHYQGVHDLRDDILDILRHYITGPTKDMTN